MHQIMVKISTVTWSCLCKQAYEMLLQKEAAGKQNWVSDVKRVLMENGFGFVWLNQGVGNEHMFLSEFKERLILSFRQNWHAELEQNQRFSWHFAFKDVFQVEKYLMIVTNKWHRDSLANFRMRTLGLNSNKRWFLTAQSANEACPFCPSAREDESHFVFHCAEYSDIRAKCLVFNTRYAERENLTDVLCCKNEEIVMSFAKFLAEAIKLRNRNCPQE